jgi:hypothetical protein
MFSALVPEPEAKITILIMLSTYLVCKKRDKKRKKIAFVNLC